MSANKRVGHDTEKARHPAGWEWCGYRKVAGKLGPRRIEVAAAGEEDGACRAQEVSPRYT